MELSIQDRLASACPHFVTAICQHQASTLPRNGAEFFLLDSTGKEIKIGQSEWHSTKNPIYVADTTFIKRYSAVYNLGQCFCWRKKTDFANWAADLLSVQPQFIEPHLRSANTLAVPQNIEEGLAYQPSWFLHAVIQINGDMEVKIPKKFHHYIAAPPVAVAIIHSGEKCFYVKIEDHKLTEGWYDVVRAHNLGKDYNLLFAYVGHLEFDLFIFDEEGCEMNYSWSTTLGIQHADAPISWNSETIMSNTNGSVTLTACPPSSFRAARHALRCALPLKASDLQKLYTTDRFRNFCNMHGHEELTLVMKYRKWTINYINGFFTGVGWKDFIDVHELKPSNVLILTPDINGFFTGPSWKDFVHVHNLKPFDILIISPDINFVLHAMVLHMNDWENIYPWYFEDYEDL
ncbi:hypothetical protein Vadar_018068 [Vaccinium darrowii]|uniref:Uncharacterized protein n=1 Tax=Vaccinium darrowii TaxID=229202 RepID=A0ACB7ZKY8_9ERIC|nr:hypothetical protein Vadar_018068 [Vaccinium darrowii]